mmetsp:Transcript_40808/g.108135  ORF Transcript_40808/g.108135 Transcript_40808/m.108135 type:complete len:481 (-) Transcript_40808:326-1768(-)
MVSSADLGAARTVHGENLQLLRKLSAVQEENTVLKREAIDLKLLVEDVRNTHARDGINEPSVRRAVPEEQEGNAHSVGGEAHSREADELRRRVAVAEHECSELRAELSVLRGSSDCDLHSLAAEMRRELEELRRALQNAVAKGESLGQRNAELSEQVEQCNALVHDLRVSAQRGHSALQLASAVAQTLRHRLQSSNEIAADSLREVTDMAEIASSALLEIDARQDLFRSAPPGLREARAPGNSPLPPLTAWGTESPPCTSTTSTAASRSRLESAREPESAARDTSRPTTSRRQKRIDRTPKSLFDQDVSADLSSELIPSPPDSRTLDDIDGRAKWRPQRRQVSNELWGTAKDGTCSPSLHRTRALMQYNKEKPLQHRVDIRPEVQCPLSLQNYFSETPSSTKSRRPVDIIHQLQRELRIDGMERMFGVEPLQEDSAATRISATPNSAMWQGFTPAAKPTQKGSVPPLNRGCCSPRPVPRC